MRKGKGRSRKGPAFFMALQLFVAGAGRAAFELVDEAAIGADAVECVLAPERALVGRLNGRVLERFDEEAFPAQLLAARHAHFCEASFFHSGSPVGTKVTITRCEKLRWKGLFIEALE